MLKKDLNYILNICAEEFNVNAEEVKSNSKKQELVYCRKAFCLITKQLFDLKNEIPAFILNRAHQDISYLLKNQPSNKYYNIVLERIKYRLKTEKSPYMNKN